MAQDLLGPSCAGQSQLRMLLRLCRDQASQDLGPRDGQDQRMSNTLTKE